MRTSRLAKRIPFSSNFSRLEPLSVRHNLFGDSPHLSVAVPGPASLPRRRFLSSPAVLRRGVESKTETFASPNSRFESSSEATAAGRIVLDNVPKGRFTLGDFATAHDVLDHFCREKKAWNPRQVTLCFDLMERLVLEASNVDKQQTLKLSGARFCTPILKQWKNLSRKSPESASTPKAVTKRLYNMSIVLPEFPLTRIAVGIIMDVLIDRSDPATAPIAAAKLVEFLHAEGEVNPTLKPDVYAYSKLIQAWSESGLPDTSRKLDECLKMMLRHRISPSEVTYRILLKYWSSLGDVRKCKATIRKMELHGIHVTSSCWQILVVGYIEAGLWIDAEEALRQMLRLYLDNGEDARSLELALCRFASKATDKSSGFLRKGCINALERIFDHIKTSDDIFSGLFIGTSKHSVRFSFFSIFSRCRFSAGKAHQAFMNAFAQYDKVELVEDVFNNLDCPTASDYGILIKAYGRSGKPDLALKQGMALLEDERTPLNSVRSLNEVLEAISFSRKKDSLKTAYGFLNVMETHPRVEKFGLKPDRYSFVSLLNCIKYSDVKNAGETANGILLEMERRKLTHGPAMTKAIRICMDAGEYVLADRIMQDMEASSSQPTLGTYISVMQHWAEKKSKAAAERTENVLNHLYQLAKSNPSLRPNSAIYDISIRAWATSNSPNASQRVWKLYEKLKTQGDGAIDMGLYSTIIAYLCATRDPIDVKHAEEIIENMEQTGIRPVSLHYDLIATAHAELGSIRGASRIMTRRINDVLVNRNLKASPTPSAIDCFISLLTQNGEHMKATMFLEKIDQLYGSKLLVYRPPLTSYQNVRDAWEKSPDPSKKEHLPKLSHRIKSYASSSIGSC